MLLERLRDYLKRTGQTQKATAELAGFAHETVNRWLSEEDPQVPNPRLTELEALAGALGLSLPELISKSVGVSDEGRDEARDAMQADEQQFLLDLLAAVRAVADRVTARLQARGWPARTARDRR